MKLEVGKKYRTRNGEIVECVAVWLTSCKFGYQATCLMDKEPYNYTIDGKFFADKNNEIEYDIVEEYKKPVVKKGYLNIYPSGEGFMHPTKADADMVASPDRIECREITWTLP